MVEENTHRLNLHRKNTNDLIDLGYLRKSSIRPLADDSTKKEDRDKINEIVFIVNLMLQFNPKLLSFEESMMANLYKKDSEMAYQEALREKKIAIKNSN